MPDDHDSPATAGGEPDSARPGPARRTVLRAGALGVAAVAGAAATGVATMRTASASEAPTRPLAVTPACTGQETPASTEGPLFKPNSPARTNIVTPATAGVRLTLRGTVYDTDCTPLPGAQVEFWQCDHNGDYDTTGFTLRGHQKTDAKGAYVLETIVPRDYWGRWGRRAPHIHTQVQAPGSPLLVTQLYFPDDTAAYSRNFAALNAGDRILNRACTITLGALRDNRYAGTFDFVIKTTV